METIRTKTGMAVGTLQGNIFRKRVKGSKHLFRILNAWGMDYSILHALPEKGVVRILDTEDDSIYQTTVQNWKDNGIIKHFKQGTVDHNTQVFLPRPLFTKATRV